MRGKKFISVLLAAIMIATCMMPLSAFADIKVLNDIEIIENGFDYYQGQPFNSKNITVKAKYSDGSVSQLTDKDYDIENYNSDEAGARKVTLSYGDLSKDIDINIQEADFIYSVGKETTLSAKTYEYGNAVWENSNSNVVGITGTNSSYVWESTSTGTYRGYKHKVDIKTLKPGISVLTCKITNTGSVWADALISVNKPIETFTLNKEEIFLRVNDNAMLEAEITPVDADEQRVSWKSSDPEIADVNRQGVVEAKKKGTVVITALSWDGKNKKECTVNVITPAENIELKETSIVLNDRQTEYRIQAELYPTDVTFKGLKYKSEDETVAVVDENGVIRANGNGETNIIVESEDGFASAKAKVKVDGLVSGVEVDKDRIDFNEIGQKIKVEATVVPDNAINQELYWESNNDEVATVDEAGTVTAISTGSAQITVKSQDGEFSKVIPVEVHEQCTVRFLKVDNYVSGSNGGSWNFTTVESKQVKWGETVTIGEVSLSGYIYDGIYKNFYNEEGFTDRIPDSTKIKITEDTDFYVKYINILPEKIILKLLDWEIFGNSFTIQCRSLPNEVANTKYTIYSNNTSVASFDDGKAYKEYDEFNSETSGLSVNVEGVGEVTLTAKLTSDPLYGGNSISTELNLFIFKNKYGEYSVVDKDSPEGIIFSDRANIRIFGNNRYDTSINVAEALKEALRISKFDNIIVADGDNYADALAGSYLAKVKNAPILVIGDDFGSQRQAETYIRENLSSEGRVYILGGTGAVPESFENSIAGYDVKRLAGSDRFLTNIAILKETGVDGDGILVCSGMQFADSLSASAVGKPVLLVDDKITDAQKEYLKTIKNEEYFIIGGYGAVNYNVENEIKEYGDITRISGLNRYETSAAVADHFFGFGLERKTAVLAYGGNFPDGLSGGPLAVTLGAPLVLVDNRNIIMAQTYIFNHRIYQNIVLGGPTLISDEAVHSIMN